MAFPSLSFELDDLVRHSAPIVPMIYDPDTKRHATYFPVDFDLDAQILMCALEEEADDASSFIYKSPRPSKLTSKRVETVEVITPAQEIVNRYRAGLKVELDDSVDSVSSSGSSILQEDSSEDDFMDWDVEETPALPASPSSAPHIRFRRSRFDELAICRAEATNEMRRSGVDEEHPLVCPRAGCRETLTDVKALTYHLHMHDIRYDE
ncbi:hypothetical protein WG66_010665 [Moniliophthora roreri]|uniref:C2H2-type domain-containing protein n=1 Tax=Moniliophthora roreri TaxID=221103 RepID=A0A0W0FAF1_MONRR|nr:hypothetical protein WG66_010665 [Moniliophthora roreri]